jgi:hypothetical protein
MKAARSLALDERHMIDWAKRWYPHFMVWSDRLSPRIRTTSPVSGSTSCRVMHRAFRAGPNVRKLRQALVLSSGFGFEVGIGLRKSRQGDRQIRRLGLSLCNDD